MTDRVGRETETVETDVPLVKGRDPFERFYAHQYRPVLALAHVLSGSPSLAEELTQEAFAAAYGQWDRIDNPEGWIRTVVANKARSWFRRKSAEARALARMAAGRDAAVDEMPEGSQTVWEAVRRLPRRQAQAIALVYLEDLSIGETAAILNCSESTTRVHLTRARNTLARRLGVEEERT